jgi:hypothetical protein
VLINSDGCPAQFNVIAEAYVMNTLARADAAVVEEYLLVCIRYRAAVEDAEHYVRAMKIAAHGSALLKHGGRRQLDFVSSRRDHDAVPVDGESLRWSRMRARW